MLFYRDQAVPASIDDTLLSCSGPAGSSGGGSASWYGPHVATLPAQLNWTGASTVSSGLPMRGTMSLYDAYGQHVTMPGVVLQVRHRSSTIAASLPVTSCNVL